MDRGNKKIDCDSTNEQSDRIHIEKKEKTQQSNVTEFNNFNESQKDSISSQIDIKKGNKSKSKNKNKSKNRSNYMSNNSRVTDQNKNDDLINGSSMVKDSIFNELRKSKDYFFNAYNKILEILNKNCKLTESQSNLNKKEELKTEKIKDTNDLNSCGNQNKNPIILAKVGELNEQYNPNNELINCNSRFRRLSP